MNPFDINSDNPFIPAWLKTIDDYGYVEFKELDVTRNGEYESEEGEAYVKVTVDVEGGGGAITVSELDVTENGTYIAEEGTAYSPVVVEVPEPTGTKQISISSNGTTTENVADYASAEISVAVPNSYSQSDEGKVVSNGALVAQTAHADVTPTTSDQTIDTTLNNSLKVKGDADLVAGNIKKDVEIFGVTGSYEGGGGGGGFLQLLDTIEVQADVRAVNLDFTNYQSYNYLLVFADVTLSASDWLYYVKDGSQPSGGTYSHNSTATHKGIIFILTDSVAGDGRDESGVVQATFGLQFAVGGCSNLYIYAYSADKTINAGSKFYIYGGNNADM